MKTKVLVSALDWGLGHAARSAEIVDKLLAKGYQVELASSGRAYAFFRKRYPQLTVFKIPNIPFTYSRSLRWFEVKMVWDFVVMLIDILLDRMFFAFKLKGRGYSLIISDNRFGIRSRRIYSIVVAHHINIQTPRQGQWASKLLSTVNCWFIRKFDEHWIPDYADPTQNLSGKLSHQRLCHANTVYIGLLSRFKGLRCQPKQQYDVVCSVSGVEPQRSIMVQKLVEIFSGRQLDVLIISGVPEEDFAFRSQNITMVSHLDDQQFCQAIKGARYVIVRGGYSTIMDLVALGRTAMLVPTPKQTEQEYLAQYLHQQGLFYSVEQHRLSWQSFEDFMHYADVLQAQLNQFRKKLCPKC